MSDVIRKRAILTTSATSITIEPERLLVWVEPIGSYQRAVDGTLQFTYIRDVTKVIISDTVGSSDFQNILAVIGSTATVSFVKEVLPAGATVWVADPTVDCLVIHPIEYEDTDTLYTFTVRLEEI